MNQEESQRAALDHRTAVRVRSFLRAEIIHSHGNSRTECTVRDLSDGGARVEAPASVTIPEYFELFIPMRNITRKARMMWRAGNEIGVSFVQERVAPAPAPPPPVRTQAETEIDAEVRLKLLTLEAETARLRAQLAEMQNVVSILMKDRAAS